MNPIVVPVVVFVLAVAATAIHQIIPEDTWYVKLCLTLFIISLGVFGWALILMPFFGVPFTRIFFPH